LSGAAKRASTTNRAALEDSVDGPPQALEYCFISNRVALGTNDMERAEKLARGIVGKRLTYRRPNEARL
jgi:hypothetical protein